MSRKVLTNIFHLTMNTGDIKKYRDNCVVTGEDKLLMDRMIRQAETSGIVSITNDWFGIYKAKCSIEREKGIYTATLYETSEPDIPLLETAGAINAEGGRELWQRMKDHYCGNTLGEDMLRVKCPETPFICDILYFPALIFRGHIVEWTGAFTKFFGISMLTKLAQDKE